MDWKTQTRKWEERTKTNRALHSELKTRLSELENTASKLEKAQERIGALEKHNRKFEHA